METVESLKELEKGTVCCHTRHFKDQLLAYGFRFGVSAPYLVKLDLLHTMAGRVAMRSEAMSMASCKFPPACRSA